MSPRLKKASETENERSTSRSTLRRENGRRRSPSPTTKSRQNASQTYGFISVFPPNASGLPRAIFHATCGPVQASVTRPVRSSTVTRAISPASPDHAFTDHVREVESKVASVVGFGG